MMLKRTLQGAAAMLLLAVTGLAAADAVSVEHAWARATRPGQTVGAAYMDLTSQRGARLLAAESPEAGAVEIHSMRMQDGVMEMRMLQQLPLPPGERVRLAPGGLHLMLFDLKRPLREGEQITLTLTLEDHQGQRQRLPLTLPVRAR